MENQSNVADDVGFEAFSKSSCLLYKNRDSLFSRCRRGWNWRFAFKEERLADGTRATSVTTVPLFKSRCGLDVLVGPYPGGRREDSVAEEIAEAFRDLHLRACEDGVSVKSAPDRNFERHIIGEPIDSDRVKDFAATLAGIRRALVDVVAD